MEVTDNQYKNILITIWVQTSIKYIHTDMCMLWTLLEGLNEQTITINISNAYNSSIEKYRTIHHLYVKIMD